MQGDWKGQSKFKKRTYKFSHMNLQVIKLLKTLEENGSQVVEVLVIHNATMWLQGVLLRIVC